MSYTKQAREYCLNNQGAVYGDTSDSLKRKISIFYDF